MRRSPKSRRATAQGCQSLPRLRAPVAALAAGALAAGVLAACGGADLVSVSDGSSRALAARPGAEVVVTLQTIGPGEFASPPAVSSSSVRFLDVSQADVVVPAGPTQRFRFQAVTPGRAVITFRHTLHARVVVDTIDVQ